MIGGAEGDRTPDLIHAMDALSQLSYGPERVEVRVFTAARSYCPALARRPSLRIIFCRPKREIPRASAARV